MKNALTSLPEIAGGQAIQTTDAPSFMQTVGASLAYKYDPLRDFFVGGAEFGFAPLPEKGYVARDHIPEDMKEYGSTLLRATNEKHMNFLIDQVRGAQDTRKTLAESGIIASFGAEVFDPINWVTIPFTGGATLGARALKTGVSTAAVVTGQEAIRYPLDPMATPEEAAINIGSSFVIGSVLGGLTGIPMQRRINAQRAAETEIRNLEAQIMPAEGEPVGEIAPSIFTDSWLYKSVTTPMKRVLTNDAIPNSVKLRTLKIANDSGILLAANKQGQKIGNSVNQNAKLLEGEWVQVYDKVLNIWGEK